MSHDAGATARQARGAQPRMSRDAGVVRRLAHAARPVTAPEAGRLSAGLGWLRSVVRTG